SDEMRRRGKNMAGRAIIALEPNDLGAREVVLEAQNIFYFGAAPSIDRLIVIPDAADVLARGHDCFGRAGRLARTLLPRGGGGRAWGGGGGGGGGGGAGGGGSCDPRKNDPLTRLATSTALRRLGTLFPKGRGYRSAGRGSRG